jgi:predicted  nucleic acid-binding Zn-ribbon protein
VQVTAFDHEIAFLRGEIAKIEDAELESMERSEGLEAQSVTANEAVADAAASLERGRVSAAERIAADKAAVEDLEKERAAEREQIDESALSIYDRIAKAKGTAVSEGVDQKCSVCQMLLRPQKWNDLRNRDNESEMMTCESCGRLLYYDPARDAPQRKTVKAESIAASIVRSQL